MTKLALLSLGVLACAAPSRAPEADVDAPGLDAATDAADGARPATAPAPPRAADRPAAAAPRGLAAVPVADLQLTNSDNRATVAAGATTAYTLTVTNAGAVLVTGATVTEAFPPALTGVAWTCSASAGGSCPASGTGNLGTAIAIAPAGTVAFAVTGVVDPSATGTLAATAIVSAPATVSDPDPANNVASDSDAIAVVADLAVAITDAPDPVAPGGTVTYAIAITDVGPSTATGLTVTDTLPAGTTLVSAGGTGWACAPGPGIATCTRPSLRPGAAPPISIVVTAPGSPGVMTDGATVAAASPDPSPANNTATQTTAVGPSADLALAIADAVDPVALGGADTYAVTVTNLGPGGAANVTVTDTLPAGAAFVGASGAGWTCNQAGGTVTCTRPALAVGAGPPIAIAFTAPATAGPIVDVASVASTSTDPVAVNNTASQATTVAASADLGIALADSADPVGAGAMLTYLATVTNAGPNTAATVTVIDTLPAGVAFASATGAGWACTHAGVVVTCTRAALAVGAAPAISIVVTAPAAGTITDTATVATTSIDPQPANNSAAQATTVIASADLAIAISDGADPVVLGGTETYTATVANLGPSAAAGVVVTDTLPAGSALVSATGTGWACAQAGATVTCTRPVLAVGAAPPIAIVVVAPGAAGAISDAATVAATTSDPVPGNNTATQQTTVVPGADLAIALVAAPSPVAAGGALTYTASVANLGPNPATNITVTDALPAGAAFSSASGTGWSCAAATGIVTCTRPALAVGAAPVLAIAVIAPAVAGTLANAVTVATATLDPIATNDHATAITPVTASADLAVAIAGPPGPVVAGGSATLTVAVANHGPSTATAPTVTATLPAGATLVGASGAGWTCTGATCTCAALAPGDAPPIELAIALPIAPGPATTTVRVAATTTDPDPTNDAAAVTTTVSPPASADLAIALAAPSAVVVGGALAYAATVVNLGPDAAADVAVTVTLPEDAAFASATGAGWTCASAAQLVTCTAPALPAGAAPPIAIAATAPAVPCVIAGGADVTATTADPVVVNGAATAITAVGPPPRADVAIAIADDGPVVAHHALTYTVRVASLGPDAPAELVVRIALPVDAAAVTAGAGWTCATAPQGVTCRAAAMTTTPIAVAVIAPAAGTASATATVSTATADPVADNDAATDTVEVTPELTVRGSGCDAGGGAPSGALATLVALGLVLRRRRLAVVVAGALALPAAAAAQSVPIERLRVALDRDGVLGAEWAGAPAPWSWNLGTWIGYAADPLVLADRDTGARVASLVHRRLGGGLFGALGLTRWLELGVELPLIYAQDASAPVMGVLASSTRGDLRIAPKLVLRQGADRVGIALVLGFTLPTGGGNAYAGDRGATFDPELVASRAWGGLRLTGDVGYVARRPAAVMDLAIDDELHARLGAGYRFARVPLELDAMAGLSTAAARPFAQINTDPREVDVAIQYGADLAVFALGGAGIGSGFGSPDYRVVLGVRLTGSAPARATTTRLEPARATTTRLEPARATTKRLEPARAITKRLEPARAIERDGDRLLDRDDDRFVPPPLVTIAPGKLDLAERVYFHSDGDVLEARSYPLLDSIAALLAAHPELARIRIVGHTDDRGGEGHNRRLSRRRAVAVATYLAAHGVAAERLEALGLGQARPIADNVTPAGRAANRRVELVIVDRRR